MNIAEALEGARVFLRSGQEAEMLLRWADGFSREQILAHPEASISDGGAKIFLEACAKRSRGVPLAYLTGHREFFGLDFEVDERVLIPRPETEGLVEAALAVIPAESSWRVADIGTGSGCIAVSFAKHRPNISLVASDISAGALEVASKNAEHHGVADRIEFLKSDLLASYGHYSCDVMCANLPYIGLCETGLVEKDVLDHEPKDALFGGETGMELYEKLFYEIAERAVRPHYMVGEIGFSQKKNIENLAAHHFKNIPCRFERDLAGFDRVFILDFSGVIA